VPRSFQLRPARKYLIFLAFHIFPPVLRAAGLSSHCSLVPLSCPRDVRILILHGSLFEPSRGDSLLIPFMLHTSYFITSPLSPARQLPNHSESNRTPKNAFLSSPPGQIGKQTVNLRHSHPPIGSDSLPLSLPIASDSFRHRCTARNLSEPGGTYRSLSEAKPDFDQEALPLLPRGAALRCAFRVGSNGNVFSRSVT
jgi:hypothetical protein